MKKTISVFLCILLIGSILSCTSQQAPDRTAQTNPTESDLPKEDLFLIATSESGSEVPKRASEFQSASAHGIGISSRRSELDQLKQTSKSPFNNGVQYVYDYSNIKATSEVDGTQGTFYSRFDVYSNGSEQVEYLADSNLIVYYSGSGKAQGEQQCSEEELLQTARDFLQKCMGAEALSKYTYSGMDPDVYGMTTLAFNRYIEGYKTDDVLSVFFADDGSVLGYNGRNACKFDAVTAKITKEKLDGATAKLMKKINALELVNLTHGNPTLTTNTSGEVFIKIWIRYEVIESFNGNDLTDTRLDSLYVRVN